MINTNCFGTLVPSGGVYVGFSSSHSSKSSVEFSSTGGSVGLSERFSVVLKTMWDNVGVKRAVFGRFQAGGERKERVQGFRAREL